MKHTPSPWKVQECYDGKYEMTSPGKTLEDTRLIGVIEPACNIKNDAPIIQAAPKLFELNKRLLKQFNNYEEVTCTIEEIRRELVKIEGGLR